MWMNPPPGTSPTQVHLADGSVLAPNGVFPADVPPAAVPTFLAIGWTPAAPPAPAKKE